MAGQPSVVAIFGPTGIGKTAVAIALAERLRARGEDPVAVSVDSMQVYRELPIVTGAPTALEQQRLEHRLVGSVSVADAYDVATHAAAAHREIDELRSQGRRPIVVGGTGLYLRAALTELDLVPPADPELRERLSAELQQDGQEALYARLSDIEPDLAATIAPTDSRRTLRALEGIEQGRSAADRTENRLWTADTRVPTELFALVMDRDALYAKIDARVDEMVALGAADEVRGAEPLAGRTARQALGFDELLAGDIDSLKTNTRRYAKRQLTWLRKLPGACLVEMTGSTAEQAADAILAEMGTN
ncbi:MAG: tRNA (adenosine(37)-N6)-dimethylallyltransferase MiaA [Actinobacteria bacterium]|nr:tRNA (adenosine(37)-N6)-dimethylallyltransferase MiaA [Actinomycetota bacterium]